MSSLSQQIAKVALEESIPPGERFDLLSRKYGELTLAIINLGSSGWDDVVAAAEQLDVSGSILHMDLGRQRPADPPLHAEAANFVSSVSVLLRSLLDNDNPPSEIRSRLERYAKNAAKRAELILDLDARKQERDKEDGLTPFKTTLKRILIP